MFLLQGIWGGLVQGIGATVWKTTKEVNFTVNAKPFKMGQPKYVFAGSRSGGWNWLCGLFDKQLLSDLSRRNLVWKNKHVRLTKWKGYCSVHVVNFCSFYRAMLCIRGRLLAMALCLSVRPSDTSRCSTKTAKRGITQTTPHDSPWTLVFWRQRSPRNSTRVTPYEGAECRWGGSKSATFDQ